MLSFNLCKTAAGQFSYQRLRLLSSLSKDLEKFHQSHDDVLLQSVKASKSAWEVFDVIRGRGNLTKVQTMKTLQSLFVLHKTGNSSISLVEIRQHAEFETICANFKRNARKMSVSEAIEALKIVTYFGVQSKSLISTILLNLIKIQINDLLISELIFLDFILRKMESTPLVEALMLALPMLLQINIGQLDHENVFELVELLTFVAHSNVSQKTVMSIVSALTLHGENLTVREARSVIWAMCDLRGYSPHYDKLIINAMNVLEKNINELPFEQLETTVEKLTDKFSNGKHPIFYDEILFTKITEAVIQKIPKLDLAFYFLRKLNKISFVSIPLLEYICEQPEKIQKISITNLFTIITALSTANYKPSNWDILRTSILENAIFDYNKIELPWMKFTSELLSLGIYNEKILDKIFSDNFLELYMDRELNFLDHIQLLAVVQIVKTFYPQYGGPCPDEKFLNKGIEINFLKKESVLKKALELAYGGEQFIVTKVATTLGHCVDHLVAFDESNNPINFVDKPENVEEAVQQGFKAVTILCVPRSYYPINSRKLKGFMDIRIKSLEKIIPTIVIVDQQWLQIPDIEKVPYLVREINHKLK